MGMQGFEIWRNNLKKIWATTRGIECIVGIILYCLTLLSLHQWILILLGSRNKARSSFVDLYVFFALILSVAIFVFWPTRWLSVLSAYLSASTVVVLLNVVLLREVLGDVESPGRSLLLFICNVTQIVFMFATLYYLGEHKEDALLKSVLTFATIGYADRMPKMTMVQIGTDFLLVAIFLSHLMGVLGSRVGKRT